MEINNDDGLLWDKESDVVLDVRKEREKLETPNESGMEAFDCTDLACKLQQDEIRGLTGVTTYQDSIDEILSDLAEKYFYTKERILDLEKDLSHQRNALEALAIALGYTQFAVMDKKEKIILSKKHLTRTYPKK